jgi:D-3-phosphoglycerate dehydrogenase
MKVCGYDPYVAPSAYSGPAERVESLDELLAAADFLTLHVGLTEETRHLLDDRRIAGLKPGCRVLNTSRGAVIDERALVRALEENRIAGAALDVFPEEPLPAGHPLLELPNVILTPHIAGASRGSARTGIRMAAESVAAYLRGEPPPYCLNYPLRAAT